MYFFRCKPRNVGPAWLGVHPTPGHVTRYTVTRGFVFQLYHYIVFMPPDFLTRLLSRVGAHEHVRGMVIIFGTVQRKWHKSDSLMCTIPTFFYRQIYTIYVESQDARYPGIVRKMYRSHYTSQIYDLEHKLKSTHKVNPPSHLLSLCQCLHPSCLTSLLR